MGHCWAPSSIARLLTKETIAGKWSEVKPGKPLAVEPPSLVDFYWCRCSPRRFNFDTLPQHFQQRVLRVHRRYRFGDDCRSRRTARQETFVLLPYAKRSGTIAAADIVAALKGADGEGHVLAEIGTSERCKNI